MKQEKSPVRVEIEREVMAVLSGTERPLTTAELIEVVPSAQDKTELAKILNLMESEGMVEKAEPRRPGEPGGMSGKGARPVNTWRLATSPDDSLAAEALRRMYGTKEDDAEVCLDSAATSQNGDELAHLSGHERSDAELDRLFQRLASDTSEYIQEEARIASALGDEPEWPDDTLDIEELTAEVSRFHNEALWIISNIADKLLRSSIPEMVKRDIWEQVDGLRWRIDSLNARCGQ